MSGTSYFIKINDATCSSRYQFLLDTTLGNYSLMFKPIVIGCSISRFLLFKTSFLLINLSQLFVHMY